MQWHPTLSTLLMVACEDDMSPVIQLWDLRSAAAMTPAKELLGHNKVGLHAHCLVRMLQVSVVGGQALTNALCYKSSIKCIMCKPVDQGTMHVSSTARLICTSGNVLACVTQQALSCAHLMKATCCTAVHAETLHLG